MNSDDIIASTEKKKDLGIRNDSSLDFHSHTHQTVSIANHTLDLISKCFQYLDNNKLHNLYNTTQCPILECGNIVWVHILLLSSSPLKNPLKSH